MFDRVVVLGHDRLMRSILRGGALFGLTFALVMAMAGTAIAKTKTVCYALPRALDGRSLVASESTTPPDPYAEVGHVRTRVALQFLIKATTAAIGSHITANQVKVVGTIRSDIDTPRPDDVEVFATLATLKMTTSKLGWAFGFTPAYGLAAPATLSLTPEKDGVTLQGPTDGTHAVWRFTAASPMLFLKHNTGIFSGPKFAISATSQIGIADGVGNSSFALAEDTAKIPNGISAAQRKSEGWTQIDCRTRFDGKPPILPQKLPGLYHCNFAIGKRGIGIFPSPPHGLYDLRLRPDGAYNFGGDARYPAGTFDYKSKTKSLAFAGGYLAGVHGTWLPNLARSGQPFAGSQGIKLSSFPISPGATKGKHSCIKI